MSYQGFARIYDSLMDDFDYRAWADYYEKLLPPRGEILEAAAGTGNLTLPLIRLGHRITATDLSSDMLEILREKLMKNGLRAQVCRMDMTALQVPHKVDAVLCGCDGINYLTSPAAVRAFFESAKRCLKPGGVLAFDMSSPYKLETVTAANVFYEDRDDVTYLWTNSLDAEKHTVTMDLAFFSRRSDGLYERTDETHVMRAHSVNEITEALKEAGFADVRVFGDRTFEAPAENEMRVHFAARG